MHLLVNIIYAAVSGPGDGSSGGSGSGGINWDSLVFQTAPNLAFHRDIGSLIGGTGYFPGIIFFFYILSGLALLIYLVWGGLQLMTSGGDPGKIESGKKIITNALIGIVIVLTSYWVVQLVGLFFNLPGITNAFR